MHSAALVNTTLQFLTAGMLALVLPASNLFAQALAAPEPVVAEPVDAVDAVDKTGTTGVYEPLKGRARLKWVLNNSISPRRFAGYIVTSAIGTGTNAPREYGPHWEGFGKRIALRASTSTTGLLLEAGIGALWDEDPRYVRTTGKPVKGRILNAVKMSFMSRNSHGDLMPSYARFISVPSSAFITRTWRPESQTGVGRTVSRIPLSFLDRMISNTFNEFWPDIRKKLGRK